MSATLGKGGIFLSYRWCVDNIYILFVDFCGTIATMKGFDIRMVGMSKGLHSFIKSEAKKNKRSIQAQAQIMLETLLPQKPTK